MEKILIVNVISHLCNNNNYLSYTISYPRTAFKRKVDYQQKQNNIRSVN